MLPSISRFAPPPPRSSTPQAMKAQSNSTSQRTGRLTTAFIEAIIQAHPTAKITGDIVDILEALERSFGTFDMIKDPKMGQGVQLSYTHNQTIEGLQGAICKKVTSFNFFPNLAAGQKLTDLLNGKAFLEALQEFQNFISSLFKQEFANLRKIPALNKQATQIQPQVEDMVFEGINGSPQERMEHLIRTATQRERLEKLF